MTKSNDYDETTHSSTLTSSFNQLYLASELRSHQEVNEKNLKATEGKIRTLLHGLEEHASDNSVKFSEFGKSTEELKQLKVQLLEQEKTLREASEKERDIQEELANLKNRLEELESEKVAYDKANKNVFQENKVELAVLDKVIRAYSSNFSMNLNVVSSDNNKISCKISFKENPNCLVFIEIDKNKPQINSFHTKGLTCTDEIALRNKFNEHQDFTQLLIDLRNLILKMPKL